MKTVCWRGTCGILFICTVVTLGLGFLRGSIRLTSGGDDDVGEEDVSDDAGHKDDAVDDEARDPAEQTTKVQVLNRN